ncbi:hypothetical protein Aduo_014089 [Ancylostoma duodenale]
MLPEKFLEASKVVGASSQAFLIHALLMLSCGFTITFVSLSYSWTECRTKIPNGQLFWVYFAFGSAIFIGSIFTSHIIERLEVYRLQFCCLSVVCIALWFLSIFTNIFTITVVLLLIGLSIGVVNCSTPHTFITIFHEEYFCMIHVLYIFLGIGKLFAALIFQTSKNSSCAHSSTALGFSHMSSLEKFHVHGDVNMQYVLICFTVAQLPVLYLLLTSKVEVTSSPERRTREQYEDIEHDPHHDAHSLKLVLLCAVLACTATVLHSLFPFLLLAHQGGSLEYQCFMVFVVSGRVVAMFTADKVAPYFYMGLSIIGCGAACCVFVFDNGLLAGSMIFGFFISSLLPSLIVYIRHTLVLPVDRLFVLMSGSSFGYVIYPLFLTLANSSESRIFIAIDFFAVLLLVLIYVFVLNLQAQIERTRPSQDSLKIFIDRFFSGEAMLKRTRSIRPLISRLRPNSYRRFRGRGASASTPQPSAEVPKIEVTLEKSPQIQYN